MKRGVTFSLIISVLLIGGALFFRFKDSIPNQGLITAQNNLSDSYYKDLTEAFLNTASSTSISAEGDVVEATQPSLNTTDIVSRQLISDYITLEQNGQATESNLNTLASQYADSIKTIITPVQITLTDLKIVKDSSQSIKTYSNELGLIYNSYLGQLNIAHPITSADSTATQSLANQILSLYTETATKLKTMPVPIGLADLHLQLTNIILSDVTSSQAIANSELDPTAALAGLITFRNNATKEQNIMGKIQQLLIKYGV